MSKAELTHEEVQELIGSYALNAVDEDERRGIDRHMETCARCRSELAEHLETAANLVPAEVAPRHLWDKIETSLEGTPVPDLQITRAPRARVPTRWLRIAAAVGTAAAVAIAFLSFKVVSQDRRIDELAETVVAQSLEKTAQAALVHPEGRKVVLRNPEDARLVAQLVLLPDGSGYLVDDNLGALGEEQIYQLWALIGDQKISAGVLGSDPDVVAFMIAGPVDGFAITAESGPVVSPTTDPVVLGFLNDT